MERRQQIETEVGWFSMKIEREVLDETKRLAKEENISLAGYVSNLMKDAVYKRNLTGPTNELKESIDELTDTVKCLSERLRKLEDKTDCTNVIVTKLLGEK